MTVTVLILLFFWPVVIFSQITIAPRISANHNHFEWNAPIGGFTDPQEWTYGLGVVSRAQLSEKIYGGLSFNYYPLGISFASLVSLIPYTVTTNIIDVKIGFEYQIYPNTLVGLGFEVEQYFQTEFEVINSSDIEFGESQKQYGFETSITQRFGRIELFADIFIGLNEVRISPDQFARKINILSHKKLQLGIGIPISLK